MKLHENTQQEIKKFAAKEAYHHIDRAEMTYMERLKAKAHNKKRKFTEKAARFKRTSEIAEEARNDLHIYMTDFILDLMEQGATEEEALETAKRELCSEETSEYATALRDQIIKSIENRDIETQEVIGLLYGSFTMLGLLVGAVAGFFTSGGRTVFLEGGWIDTLIGLSIGLMVGICIGMFGNAILITRSKR